MSTLLDQKFWVHFAQNVWEKKPVILKNVKSDLLQMGESEIFKLLVLYSDHCRKLKNSDGFKFYINGLRISEEEVLELLPVKKDKSLLGYHQRMEEMFEDYCLVCDELLKVNADKQNLLTDFTDDLYKHVGFPNRFSEMGLYLGNYRKTPFGVHVDRCGVFSFPVAGTKKFRLWTSEYVKKNPQLDRAFEYNKYKKDSQLLTAQAGDMTYWPSSSWHIAESEGSFSATWSLGVWVDKTHQTAFSESLGDLLKEKMGASGQKPTTAFKKLYKSSGEVSELPDSVIQSIEILRSLSPSELRTSFLTSWMKHISLQGFKNTSVVNSKLTLKSKIKLRNKRSKILWQEGDQTNLFSFGGVLVESQKAEGLLKLVKALNAGEVCLVSDFIKSAKAIKSLQEIASAGALG